MPIMPSTILSLEMLWNMGTKARVRIKNCYLLNSIRCDKLSMADAAVREHQEKYEKDFDVVVILLTHDIDKRAPTPNVKVASVA